MPMAMRQGLKAATPTITLLDTWVILNTRDIFIIDIEVNGIQCQYAAERRLLFRLLPSLFLFSPAHDHFSYGCLHEIPSRPPIVAIAFSSVTGRRIKKLM